MPVGSVVALAGDPIGDDFLYCNGADVPGGKSGQYGEGHLFDVIGYDYGGSGENFKLPDFRGRVPVGVEGNPVFSNVIGTRGGTDNTSTNGSALAINQIPAHRHKFIDNEGHSYFAFNDQNRGPDGDLAGTRGDDTSRMQEMGSTSTTFPDSIINHTTYTGGGANGGIHGGTTAADDLSSLSGTTPHSHAITAANRAQPYITVKWFIKAKKNSKLDFTIQVGSDSALEAVDTTKTGNARFISDIKPIDGTVTLRSKIDGSSIVVENNQLRIAENPIIRNNPDIGGRIIARNGVGSHLTGEDRLGNGSDHQIFGRIRVGFRGNEANNNNPPTYDQAIAYVGGDRVGTSDRLILAANDQVWLSVGAISHIHGGDSGTPTGTNSFRSQNNAGFRLINVNEMVNGTNTALYAYATLPRTRNSDINTGGAKSIITKQYLEDVFDLTDGVLTINLDPGDPT